MLKIVESEEKSAQEQTEMQDAMRVVAMEINFIDQRFPVSPRVRELVRLIPEVVHDLYLPFFMLIEDSELEVIMKTIDRKALATADYIGAVKILNSLRESANEIVGRSNPSRYTYHVKWQPLEARIRDALIEAQYASFFLPGIPEKDPNTGGWRFDVHAVYRNIKISAGYVLVSGKEEVTVELKDNWKGYFLESHILWLYKNSAVFFPG